MPEPHDMERKMARGCAFYTSVSLIGFGLSVAPFFLMLDHEHLKTLLLCCALGQVPHAVLGYWAGKRSGLAGAGGYFAACLAFGIFLALRIWQMILASHAHRIEPLDYPESLVWLLPLACVAFAALIAVISVLHDPDLSDVRQV